MKEAILENNETLKNNDVNEVDTLMPLIQTQEEMIKYCGDDLRERLKSETTLLDITALFSLYYDSAERFAACLLFLLRNGFTPDMIVELNLLQSFFSHHVPTLDCQDSPIHSLYHLLNAFDEAKDLVQIAAQVHCGLPQLPQHALNGEKREGKLETPETPFMSQVTLNTRNFEQLYAVFGLSFLLQAFKWYSIPHHAVLDVLLRDSLNKGGAAFNQLADLIKQVAMTELSFLLEGFADLLSSETIQDLLDSTVGAILYLTPYKPEIAEKLTPDRVEACITEILKADSDSEKISQLVKMANAFSKHKPEAERVYKEIIDILLETTSPIQPYWVYELKRCPCRELFSDKIKQLEGEFNEHFVQLVHTEFNPGNFNCLEEVWGKLARQKDVLQRTSGKISIDRTPGIPMDRYALRMRVVRYMHDQQPLNEDDFLSLLNILAPLRDYTEHEITLREKTLIEVLTTIDSVIVIECAIKLLINEPINQPLWMLQENIPEDNFFHRLWRANYPLDLMTLLTKYSDPHDIPPEKVQAILVQAIKKNQLEIIPYLCRLEPDQFTIESIDQVLCWASKQGHLNLVKYFCNVQTDHKLNTQMLNTALSYASEEGHVSLVTYFCSLTIEHKPSSIGIDEALNRMVYWGELEAVQYICSLQTENKPSQKGVDEALGNVYQYHQHRPKRPNTPAIVQYLCSLKTDNKPSHKGICAALSWASKQGHLEIIQLLCNLQTENKLTQWGVAGALENAAAAGHLEMVQYLCSLQTDNKPSQWKILQALIKAAAAGHFAIVKYLCHLQIENPPTQEEIEKIEREIDQAFVAAASAGHLDIAIYLCNLPDHTIPASQWAINMAFSNAAREGNLEKAQALYKFKNGPDKDTVRSALYDTAANSHLAIIEYLYSLQTTTSQVSSAFGQAISCHRLENVKYFCSLQFDNQPLLSREDIEWGLYKAINANDLDIIHYLCHLKTKNKPDTACLNKAMKAALERNRVEIVQYFYALRLENQSDLEGLDDQLRKAVKENYPIIEDLFIFQAETIQKLSLEAQNDVLTATQKQQLNKLSAELKIHYEQARNRKDLVSGMRLSQVAQQTLRMIEQYKHCHHSPPEDHQPNRSPEVNQSAMTHETVTPFIQQVKKYEETIQALLPLKLWQKIVLAACTFVGGLLGALIGAVAGIITGAAIGGGAGSVVPVLGNIAGAVVGGNIAGSDLNLLLW